MAVGAIALTLSAGCSSSQPVTMADSFDLDIFGPHVDDLHTPYVAGAQITITVSASETTPQSGWTLSSSDSNVVKVSSALYDGSANIVAVSPGQATLTLTDGSGNVLDSHAVSVAVPNQVNLYAQGLLLTGATDQAAQVSQASVVQGGEATFLARYFLNGAELYGNSTLQSTPPAGVTSTTVSPSFASDRDFLQIQVPNKGMSGVISLLVNNVQVGEVTLNVVPPSQVSHVTILEQNSVGSQSGANLLLFAHAVDANSNDVFGASFSWLTAMQGGGVPLSAGSTFAGPADLFFYTFDPTTAETVTADYDGFSPSTVVHAVGGSVGSTAQVGCSLGNAPGLGASSGVGLGLGLALALMGAGARRRRR